MDKKLLKEINRSRQIMGLSLKEETISEVGKMIPGFSDDYNSEESKKKRGEIQKWQDKGIGDKVKQYEMTEREFNEIYDELKGQMVFTTGKQLTCARAGGVNCNVRWFDFKDNVIGSSFNDDLSVGPSVKRAEEFLNNYKIDTEQTITTWEEWRNSPLWEGTHLYFSKDDLKTPKGYDIPLTGGGTKGWEPAEKEKENYFNGMIPNYGGIVYKTI